MFSDLLTIWSDSPALSLAIWLVIAITLLYAGRPHAHQLLRNTGRAFYRSLRLAGAGVRQLENRVSQRNRDVLLAAGREEAESAIEREFARVAEIVERDLGQYPVLHRRLNETLEKIETDYHNSIENKPMPPAWQELMDTIGNLPTSGDPAVNSILENIRDVVQKSHDETLEAYQSDINERHGILKGMRPDWRNLGQIMGKVHETITGLDERSKSIDRQMAEYERMRNSDDEAVNTLMASSLKQFFISSLVLTIAVFGAIVNFHLIAMPMSEMVGGTSSIGPMAASDVAALVIIMVEITMGLFLLESLRVTHLFPVIARLNDRMRRYLMIASLVILVIFAGIESSLAYLRDILAADQAALAQQLTGEATGGSEFGWIPAMGQMLLGFILPFALAFVGIPLESFVHSLRTVLGAVTLGVLRALRLVLRVTGGLANHLCAMLINLYDLLIMVPLSIERMVRYRMENRAAASESTSRSEPETAQAEASEPAPETQEQAPRKRSRKRAEPSADETPAQADDLPLTTQEA